MTDETNTTVPSEPQTPTSAPAVVAETTAAPVVAATPVRSATASSFSGTRGGSQGGYKGSRSSGPSSFGSRSGGPSGDRSKGGDRRGGPRREPRAKPEFDQKIIDIRRVTRVSSGGRRFSFAVSLVAGDRKGKVGVGTGKGGDTALAVEKAFRNAKKNMISINLTKTSSIAHEVLAKFSSAHVHMMPAPGRGVVAGSSVRVVIELAGIKDITAKLRSGTKNKLNNARVALQALSIVKKPRTSRVESK